MRGIEKASKRLVARRDFLGAAGAAAGLAVARTTFALPAEGVVGANERIGVGFIGTGGRCGAHIDIVNALAASQNLQPVAVCDVYLPRAEDASKRTGNSKIYRKHHELLADPKVDLVCIASPDRHHAPQAIDAVRAGKDVYVEKPLTHWTQFDLARQLAEEAEKLGRIVQVGTQYMADAAYGKVRDLLKQGAIGKPVHAQAGFFRRGDWGEVMPIPDENAKPGPSLDWEAFVGDAPRVPFTVSRFFQWRLYWDYSGGPATDLLVHTYTPIFCMLGVDYPERVSGMGGKWQYTGLREVPDTFNMVIDYPGGPSVVLMNTLSNETGCESYIRGTEGLLRFEGTRIIIQPHGAAAPSHVIESQGFGDTTKLWANLIESVRTRKKPLSPVDVGARVQAPLNMAILSYRESKVARFDAASCRIVV
jgi:predicted dehydrogenase